MSGVILSTIFDFGLEGKLRLLKEEADAVVLKKKKCGDAQTTEVEPPEILWMKSGDETVTYYGDGYSDEGESVDSDSDTITNEMEEEPEGEGGYYEAEDPEEEEEDGSEEEGIFEWEMTTILEETEDEEDEDQERQEDESVKMKGESENGVTEDENESGIDLGVQNELFQAGSYASESTAEEEVDGRLLEESPRWWGSSFLEEEDEHEQGETGISTRAQLEKGGESGTPADEQADSASSTFQDDHPDSLTPPGPAAESVSPPHPTTPDSACHDDDLQGIPNSDECTSPETRTAGVDLIPEQSDTSPGQPPSEYQEEDEKDNRAETGGKDEDGGGGMHSTQQRLLVINNNGPESRGLRSVLRKPGNSKGRKGRCVTFNESLNLFYDAECSCWVHEDDYARYRQEEYERREREELYQYEPLPLPVEYDEPPTLSPPEGYKDRFFPQEFTHTNNTDPDVTRVSPPSPPTARRKVFLRDPTTANGQEEEAEEESSKKRGLRLGGILKGGRLWRSNSSEGKKVISPPEEPDLVKCTESSSIQTTNSYSTSTNTYESDPAPPPTKVSIGTAPLRTSEQIRLAVDSTLRSRKNKKPECSNLVEKLRWLTSLEDEDSDSNQSGFATWPSPRDKNGVLLPPSSSTNQTKKSDAGTCTNEEHFVQSSIRHPAGAGVHEAKIKQISYTLEDIEEGLKGTELELESFISKDGGRMERIRKRYGEEGGDDYGFSRRPSVKGIKPKFSSTNQIFAQFTNRKSMESPALGMSSTPPHPPPPPSRESEYENTRLPAQPPPPPQQIIPSQAQGPPNGLQLHQSDAAAARTSLSYEFQNAPGRQTEESRAHFELIRQSFENVTSGGGPNFITNYHRPHSWSVSTLPHPHHHNNHPPPPALANHHHLASAGQVQQSSQQPLYGTVRRVPNVIGRPLFLHYGALSVEAHPNKIPYPPQQAASQVKVPETPSPTQQTPVVPMGMRYYGPPIRYYNQPPPVPPRTVTAGQPLLPSSGGTGGVIVPAPVPIGINNLNMPPSNPTNHAHPHVNVMAMAMNEAERGVPEGATDEEHLPHKETYSMNV